MNDELETGVISEAAAQVDRVYDDQQPADNISNEAVSQSVPLEALQAERAQRQSLQEELRVIKDHIALMQSQQQQASQKPEDDFDGLTKDDVLTVGDFQRLVAKRENQFKPVLDELRMTQKYPDYQHVITQYLPEVIKQNPSLMDSLKRTQDYELAYYLAKNSDAYKSQQKTKKQNADAEKIIKNSQQSGSLASVERNSAMNTAKRYKDMSDADFQKEVQKNLGFAY